MIEATPRFASLPEALAHHARLAPGREAARDADETLNYEQLERAVDAFAQRLAALGLRRGERLAYMGTPGLPYWICLLGGMKAGAVWMGLNPQHTERELAHVLADASPRLCIVGSNVGPERRAGLRSAIAGARAELALVEARPGTAGLQAAVDGLHALGAPQDPHREELAATDVALLVYTSGSTGTPKGALLTNRGLVENGWWMARRMDFHPVRGLVNLPINHVGCVGDLCATVLIAGGTAVFMERFDAARTVPLLLEQSITWIGQVPAQFQLMMQHGLAREQLRSVRWLHWGGAPMPEPLARKLADWVPDVNTGYGQTECSGTMTLTARGASFEVLTGTVGRVVEPGRLRVADEADRALPDGECGEVQLRGPHLFHGYLNRPDATGEAFTADGWLRTGDLGSLDEEGNLRLLGRTREMFKSGGYNIYPREIEAVIEALPGVQLCAVIGVPDALWGEVGVAFVKAPVGAVAAAQLQAHCAVQLARYKIPKRFVVREALPLLPVGKVDKQRLREELLSEDRST